MQAQPVRYRFDDVEIDALAHRVLKAGVACALEPKAFAVLCELVARPGELVLRDQLLDAVWGHRHVTPGVLNRVVASLRKTLGDEAAEPRYIETVHGLGYRFVGALRELPATQDPLPESPPPAAAGAAVAQRVDEANAPAHAAPTRRAVALVAAPLVAVLAVVAATSVWRQRAWEAETVAVKPVTLAVLPFSARGDDADLAAAAEGISESLTDAFTRMPALSIAGRDSVFALGRGRASPQRVADALGVEYVLGGEAVPDGNAVELSVSLWRHGEAAPVWTDNESLPRAQMFRMVVKLIAHVQTTLAPRSMSAVSSTAAVPAQDLYWLGRRYWHQRTPESLARSLGYFQRAVEEDPRFALGYTGVADAAMLLYEYGDMIADEATAKAHSAVARAKELDPNLADAYASEGLILIDEDRQPEAVASLAHALKLQPQLPNAMLWYGNALAYTGRARDAREWHAKVLAQDPLNPMVQTYLGVDAMMMGDEPAATAAFRRAIELNPGYPEPYWQLALQHQFHGRLAEALSVYGDARKRQGANDWTALFVAYADVFAGDADAAITSADAAAGVTPIERAQVLVRAHLLQGRAAQARKIVEALPSASANRARRAALLARIDLAEGRDEAARKGYDAVFGERPELGDVLLRVWLSDFDLGHYAAWIALLPQDTPPRKAAQAAYRAQLEHSPTAV